MEETINQTDKQNNKKMAKEVILNAFSNILFLFCLWLMSLLLPKLSPNGFESAGVFTMCLSVANIATAISTYNIYVFYSSDTKNEFGDEHYFYFGMMTTFISLIVCFVMCFIYGYSGEVFWSVVLYYCFKMFDNFALVLRSALQRAGKLVKFSYSLIVRSFLSLGVFVLVMYLSKSLILTMGCLAIFGLLYFVCVDLMITRKYCSTIFSFSRDILKKASSLFILALPVCIYGLSFAAIPSIPRLMFESIFHDEVVLGYFGTMAAVTVLIQAAVSSLILPFIPKVSNLYKEKEYKKYLILVLKLVAFVIGLTAVAFVMVFFLGDWALNLVYGKEILEYSSIFKWIVLATGLQSIVIVLSDTTVATRRLKTILVSSLVGVAVMGGTMYPLIYYFSLSGIVYVYFASYGLITLILLTMDFVDVKRKNNAPQVEA